MLPGQRELYLHEAEKYISELRELMKKDKKNKEYDPNGLKKFKNNQI
jgi:hypothetical protein